MDIEINQDESSLETALNAVENITKENADKIEKAFKEQRLSLKHFIQLIQKQFRA